ncbi:TetR/AcrR family transcriptional regulator [Nocardioides humilatus]|uniref:TetR/AcrR family transcriptional regulator n=1 Tax=Nocardioides humilatus TaxID=2607660 RepID=UPI00165FD64C|nr:TetR/AcrR family transcriptional regulator [Nocardioides humilatus]
MLGTPTRDRKAERRAAVRREILDAAWAIARESGLTQITLRDVAQRIGMQAPSLYTHFDSKMAIYDAMFAESWAAYGSTFDELRTELSPDPRTALHQLFRHFYDYAIADHPRYQLMNERVIPGFEPSAESYAPSQQVFAQGHSTVTGLGNITDADFLIFMSLLGGLVNQHFANDPGGTRVTAVLERAVDMWADAVGLPPSPA